MAHTRQTHVGGAELEVEAIREPRCLMSQAAIREKSSSLTLELDSIRHSKTAPSRPFQNQLFQQETNRECNMAAECEEDCMTTARDNDETHSCTPRPLAPSGTPQRHGHLGLVSQPPPRNRDGEFKQPSCVLGLRQMARPRTSLSIPHSKIRTRSRLNTRLA